jgi:hypothetical protein
MTIDMTLVTRKVEAGKTFRIPLKPLLAIPRMLCKFFS